MAKEIKFNIKLTVDGKEQLTTATAGVQDLRKALGGAAKSTGSLKHAFEGMAGATQTLRNVQDALSGLQGALQGLAGSYYASEEQKTKMLTVMRQRMDATEGEISATNRLIAAQTELGVLGGTVQRAGAQQLATFLKTSASLNTLIPAMNDLVAQQRGLTADTQDAVGVANLMGKAMTGQTSALRRVGIIFTEAQEKVLKYGDEQERAAALAQVITDNVGHMNAALAGTDAGRIKQITNDLGAWRVRLGEIASKAMPYLTVATGVLNSALAVMQIRMAGGQVLGLANALRGLSIASAAAAVKASLLSARQAVQVVVTRALTASNTALGVSGYAAAAGLTATKLALRGLLIATGIGALVAALTFGLEKLINALDGAGGSAKGMGAQLTDAQRAAKETAQTFEQTSAQTYGGLKTRYTELQNAWKRLRGEHEKNAWIKDNQSAFNGLRLSVHSVKDAEDVFVKNTSKVEAAFKKRAEAAANAAVLTELYEKKLRLELQMNKRNRDATEAFRNVKVGDTTVKREALVRVGTPYNANDHVMKYLPAGSFDKGENGGEYLNEAGVKAYKRIAPTVMVYKNDSEQHRLQRELNAVNSEINEAAKRQIDTRDTGYTPDTKPSRGSAGGGSSSGGDKKLTEIAHPLSESDYQNNLRFYEEQKAKVDMTTEAYAKWRAKIKETQAAFDKLKGESRQKSEIANPASVNDYENNLSVLRERQKAATSPEDYAALQKQIDATTEALKRFKGEAEETYKPGAVAELDTMEKLDKALGYYQERLSKATAAEIAGIQRTIDKLSEKKEALQSAADLTARQAEADRLSGLQGGARRRRVRGVGAEGFTSRIDELQAGLDTGLYTGGQARDVERLINAYKRLRAEAGRSFSTLREGWGGVQGIGDGISSMQSALEGNADAWATVTSVVSAALQVYDGVAAVVEIIKNLTSATKDSAGAKTQEAAATMGSATASVANAGAKTAEAAASRGSAAAKSGEAVADATESGAKLPFPYNIAAIAAGVAAVLSALAMASKFAGGGIVPGSSVSGDRMLARVNSGEMILNKSQQSRLFALLDGRRPLAALPGVRMPRTVGDTVSLSIDRSIMQPDDAPRGVSLRVRGRELVGVLANETRQTRRRSNIRL